MDPYKDPIDPSEVIDPNPVDVSHLGNEPQSGPYIEFGYEKILEQIQNANIIRRYEWDAVPAKEELEDLPTPIKSIGYSCDTQLLNVCRTREECIKYVQNLQERDMYVRGLPDISYNFLIGDDGNVYEGRGWDKRPAVYYTDKQKYDNMIDVAYMGIQEYGKPKLPRKAKKMSETFQQLVRLGVENKFIEPEHECVKIYRKVKRIERNWEINAWN